MQKLLISLSPLQIITRDQLQQEFHSTSFPPDLTVESPADLAPYNAGLLYQDDQPTELFYNYSLDQIIPNPTGDGSYVQHWIATPFTLPEVQNYLLNELSNQYNQMLNVPISFNGSFIQLTWDKVTAIRESIKFLQKAYIFDQANSILELDIDSANYVANTIATLLSNLMQANFKHRESILAITSITDGQNYNVSSGWGHLYTVNDNGYQTQIFANVQPAFISGN